MVYLKNITFHLLPFLLFGVKKSAATEVAAPKNAELQLSPNNQNRIKYFYHNHLVGICDFT